MLVTATLPELSVVTLVAELGHLVMAENELPIAQVVFLAKT